VDRGLLDDAGPRPRRPGVDVMGGGGGRPPISPRPSTVRGVGRSRPWAGLTGPPHPMAKACLAVLAGGQSDRAWSHSQPATRSPPAPPAPSQLGPCRLWRVQTILPARTAGVVSGTPTTPTPPNSHNWCRRPTARVEPRRTPLCCGRQRSSESPVKPLWARDAAHETAGSGSPRTLA